ncbi:MerR family transcriptional regulator [Nocardioides mangrovicus]|uniref:MerR family transcriptional regulator n=1 Tax=Nocardioides mangrovicus TaxID=2478913 RepID=A0A3L8P172_9ACTN|nr:MerR family transcriptional regulator [Nocardioides mangrovicus]RLV48652.1 MerR family transcriptional regulator [Nocardioides mangrovicus]
MTSAAPSRRSIGEALAQLKQEFPDQDIKESKIRFLESEGLVHPERTPSGYRKYSDSDMDRLRFILRAQKENYLPLRVIKEQLQALDEGRDPAGPRGAGVGPVLPRLVNADDGTPTPDSYGSSAGDDRISRRELVKTAGITDELLTELESYGLVRRRTGSPHYDGDALVVARTAGELAAFGIEPRHLRSFKTAADREVGLVEQVVAPIRRSREEGAEGRAAQSVNEIAALSVRLHASLVKIGLRSLR